MIERVTGFLTVARLAHAEAPEGSFYRYYYDDRGLPAALTLPAGGEMDYTYTYDPRGPLATTEGQKMTL